MKISIIIPNRDHAADIKKCVQSVIERSSYDNYEIVTSYISDKYLPGILIGYVSNIDTDPSMMSKEAYITPVVDFQHLEAVLVITRLREQLDNLDEVISHDN